MKACIAALKEGKTHTFRPVGNSMTPKIKSKQLVTVSPDISDVKVGDVVACKVKGRYFLHLVTAIGQDGRYEISNNHGYVNGWTSQLYGKVIAIGT